MFSKKKKEKIPPKDGEMAMILLETTKTTAPTQTMYRNHVPDLGAEQIWDE